MACARKRTSGTASLNAITPATTSAVMLAQAMTDQYGPCRPAGLLPSAVGRHRRRLASVLRVNGCAQLVSRPFGDSAHINPCPSASEASAKVSVTTFESAKGCIMATACEPCPGNTSASFMVSLLTKTTYYIVTRTAPDRLRPTPSGSTLCPAWIRPSRTATSSASGIDAAEVLA